MSRRGPRIGSLLLCLGLAGAVTACSGGDGRLVSPNDSDFAILEEPESPGECSASTDCEESCVHGCVPADQGPQTCPSEPTERPPKIEGASCDCIIDRCQWN